jgi:hypothetical protein
MYPKPKRDAMGWAVTIFVGAAVVLLIGAIAFGIFITQGGTESFGNLRGGNSDSSLLSLER